MDIKTDLRGWKVENKTKTIINPQKYHLIRKKGNKDTLATTPNHQKICQNMKMLMKCLAGDFLLDMEREEIEEKCLKQQQMIMEQMKNLKKVYFRDKNEK